MDTEMLLTSVAAEDRETLIEKIAGAVEFDDSAFAWLCDKLEDVDHQELALVAAFTRIALGEVAA